MFFLYASVMIVRGIKICPCPSICLTVRLSVCLSVCPFVTLYGIEFVLSAPPTVLMDLFETLHTCCGHIENVHVGF